jgi:hypothetical protein
MGGRVVRDCWDGWNFEGLCGSAGPRNKANVDAVGQVREIFFYMGLRFGNRGRTRQLRRMKVIQFMDSCS